MKDKFNTALSPKEEMEFQVWAHDKSSDLNRELLNDLEDYDLRGYWKERGKKEDLSNPESHLPDTYKKPNHPTFSDESKYSGVVQDNVKYVGGKWSELGKDKWQYSPSREMMTNTHNSKSLEDYFKKYEPDSKLVLPK